VSTKEKLEDRANYINRDLRQKIVAKKIDIDKDFELLENQKAISLEEYTIFLSY
jgi:hypothetical protein